MVEQRDDDFSFMFVTLVQSFPCLWDNNMPQFYDANIREQAWAQIAEDIGDGTTPVECKTVWTSMRESYVEWLRSDQDDGQPHYLADLMQFLVPFVVPSKPDSGQLVAGEPVSSRSPKPKSSSSRSRDEEQDTEGESKQEAERKWNRQLVEAVRACPVIYDGSLKNHANAKVLKKAWAGIASQLGSTPDECNRRWWSIRHYYVRRMQNPLLQQYYLADALEFYKPFIVIRSRRRKKGQSKSPVEGSNNHEEQSNDATGSTALSDCESSQDTELLKIKKEATISERSADSPSDSDSSFDEPLIRKRTSAEAFRKTIKKEPSADTVEHKPDFDLNLDIVKEERTLQEGSSSTRRAPPAVTVSEHSEEEEEATDSLDGEPARKYFAVDANDYDSLFLLSLLPDMKQLSGERKRIFKARMLELNEEMLRVGQEQQAQSDD